MYQDLIPNIEGATDCLTIGGWYSTQGASNGAFSPDKYGSNASAGTGLISRAYKFNASQVDAKYAGTKLQPSALTTLICIKS